LQPASGHRCPEKNRLPAERATREPGRQPAIRHIQLSAASLPAPRAAIEREANPYDSLIDYSFLNHLDKNFY
jgi:hypothetical protein